MHKLNLPDYHFRVRELEQRTQIFDSVRRKFVALTPEEWVRQNFIRYLIEEKKIPVSRIAVEMEISLNRMSKRCDVVIFDKQPKPLLIVECKAPSIKIDQEVFDQAARYNLSLNVKFLAITNGLNHYFCLMNYKEKKFDFLNELPVYDLLLSEV